MELPKGWAKAKLGYVLDVVGGSQPPKSEFIFQPKKGYIQLLQIRDFGEKPVPTFVPINRVTKFCKKDDILIARYGASLGRIVTGHEGAYNVALAKVIDTYELFSSRYLFYLLKTNILQIPLKMISRSAQNGFAKHEIAPIPLPIPPLSEQHRIVEKIEELFSELDNGIKQLKKAKEQIKTYRQAVLKAAFEGKLTNENVKDGQLPINWSMNKLIDLCEIITDGDHQAPPQTSHGIPFIVISNLNSGKIDFSNTRFVSNSYYEKLSEKRKPRKGDILYTVTGSFGIPIYINYEKEFCFQRHIGLIRLKKEIVDHKYLTFYLSSNSCYKQALAVATGTAQKTVPLNGLRNFLVPIPLFKEQELIVSEIEERFSVADKLEESIDKSLLQAEAMRQSILKKAFEGKLVPQNEQDEPAEKLLERIKTP